MKAPTIAPLLALTLAVAACGGVPGAGQSSPTSAGTSALIEVTGDISPVHDPVVIEDGGTYFLFTTGNQRDAEGLLAVRTSPDLRTWTWRGAVFPDIPEWAKSAIPGTGGIWAPDIIEHDGEYRLYYSVSTFGKNRSAIGLTVTDALDPAAPASGWTDRGAVVESHADDDFNAIDPSVFIDAEGRHWMAFGSFWSGIKMVELDPATGKRLAGDTAMHSLAERPSPGAIEAPFVIRRGGYYYLFASFDFCCRGAKSTYNTVVGRSAAPTGPYVARDGTPMLEGGGTPVLTSGEGENSRFVGRGHVAIVHDAGQDYIVYHAYDTQRNGTPTLRIRLLTWTDDGWPVAEQN